MVIGCLLIGVPGTGEIKLGIVPSDPMAGDFCKAGR